MQSKPAPSAARPWAWIPTLYFSQGIPYVAVMTLSVVMYKSLGISNADITFYTGWLYLPWVIKPLWSPVVDILKTRRWWIWIMQLVVGAAFAGVALTIPGPDFFRYTLAFFWILAFSSATHDIAADGFYLLALESHQQAAFVGVRSTFYRVATIFGQGLLVILAGYIQAHTGLPKVHLVVRARPEAALVQTIQSPRPPPRSSETLELVADRPGVDIASQPRSRDEVVTLIKAAREANVANGFSRERASSSAGAEAGRSWWSDHISGPLGGWLRGRFGPKLAAPSDAAGNIGVVALRLTQAPGREVVATVVFQSGDRSISLVEGGRLVFDDANWQKPAFLVLQLDPKLRGEAEARFEVKTGDLPFSWVVTFGVAVVFFMAIACWHRMMLPRPQADRPGSVSDIEAFFREFFRAIGSFFVRERLGAVLFFLLIFRFGEAQLVKMVVPFLLDGRELGGLGLTTGQVGWVYGTCGIVALTCGGLLGGWVVAKHGLQRWLWPMVFIIHLPDAAFIFLAMTQPESVPLISSCVAIEQFGYGFGFTAYMLYMIQVARGSHQTAHYALCTGFMALGMMLPGMPAGWLQAQVGYTNFFVWVLLSTIPSFVATSLIKIEPGFGKKAE